MIRRAKARVANNRPHKLRIEPLEDRMVPVAGVVEGLDAVKQPVADGATAHYQPQTHTITPPAGKGFLTGPQSGDAFTIATQYLQAHATELGLEANDLAHYVVTNQYVSQPSGTTHIYLEQTHNGIRVANAWLNISVTKNGEVASVGSTFLPGLGRTTSASLASLASNSPSPLKTATAVLKDVAGELDLATGQTVRVVSQQNHLTDSAVISAPGISKDPVPASLQYVATENGLKLGWRYVMRTPDGQHWYDAIGAGDDGKLLWQNDWVSHASYRVLQAPNEHPDDPQANNGFSVQTNTHNLTASPFGWHDTNGAAGAEFTDTRGNNVDAHADRDGNDVADAGSRPSGGVGLDFSGFVFNPNLAPSTAGNKNAAVVNLFYANNYLHDVHYVYGFNEASGNFQTNTYGKGGLGGDAVQADAQDAANFGFANNANFFTPPDGAAPRMQMYEFNLTSPSRDSSLDNGIIFHEYGHGVSNRLTGGPANANGLTAGQSRGMGEGWSDWWAMMFLQRSPDTQVQSIPIATYSLGQPATGGGFRAFPYSFNMSVNPLTMGSYNTMTVITPPTGSPYREEHESGEIWTSVLWDINWLMVNKHGFDANLFTGYNPNAAAGSPAAAGNKLALQLVMDGLKLQPANPTFLQARDAIIQADQALTGGKNFAELWTAFARRGMGYGATAGADATSLTVAEAFDMPPDAHLRENFDAVTAPALPFKWSNSTTTGSATWTTSTLGDLSVPNSAFVANPGTPTDAKLLSPVFTYIPVNRQLTFKNNFNLGSGDFATLDISINGVNGGAFTDIVAAGGSFVSGGYNSASGWSGNSGGYTDTVVTLPPSGNGRPIQFRWQLQTNAVGAAPGWNIDDVSLDVLPVPDFGDAPNTFGTRLASDGARHMPGGPSLGAVKDGELDAPFLLDGTTDDSTFNDDEDGVIPGILTPGSDGKFKITAPAGGVLNAWIDFNDNGIFDTADRVATNLDLTPGVNTLTVPIPISAKLGLHYARFRVTSADVAMPPSPIGLQPDGEVEDYPLNFSTGFLSENFDTTVLPGLPTGWTATRSGPGGADWITTTTSSFSVPNNAFVANNNDISDNRLISPAFSYSIDALTGLSTGQLTFRHIYNTEDTYDGGVLEISINNGPYVDILAAGGVFTSGGYTDTINSNFGNPLAGRRAWSGNAPNSILTTVTLPVAGAGQSVQLRWRLGTDNAVAATGWNIDEINVTSVNQAPVITSDGAGPTAAISLSEFTTTATVVSVTDVDVPEQTLTFTLTGPDKDRFTISPEGVLAFIDAPVFDNPDDFGADHVYDVTVTVTDDGTPSLSDSQDIAITIFKPNAAPTLNVIDDLVFNEDEQTDPLDPTIRTKKALLSGITSGGEATDTITVTATSSNTAVVPDPVVNYANPAVGGSLDVTPVPNVSGTATITVVVSDGNPSTAVTQTFTVTVNAVNDAPTFDLAAEIYAPMDAPVQSVPGFATNISVGPPDEVSQTVSFIVEADDPSLFDVQPAIDDSGTLTFTPAAGMTGLATVTVTALDSGGTAFDGDDTSEPKTFLLFLGVNRSPKLDSTVKPELIPVAEDTLTPQPTVVGSFGALGVTDADGDVLGGIAVTGADITKGSWSFSINGGTTWTPLGLVSESEARVLKPADLVRFQPNPGVIGTATLTYRAWDQSAGASGDIVDLTLPGATGLTTAFSTTSATASIRIAPIAPGAFLEDVKSAGLLVSALDGASITDADGVSSKRGIAVIGVGGATPGHWEFLSGATWKPFAAISPSTATLLRSTDKVRFVSDANLSGEAYLVYRAWDQSSGTAGTTIDISSPFSVGGSTPFSTGTDTFFIRVEPVNDRPVLDAGAVTTLSPVQTDATDPAGDLVSTILGATVTDADVGTAAGLAVTAHGKPGVSGTWQYNLAVGGGWQAVPPVSVTNAFLLGPTDRLRFLPDGVAGVTTISYKAWDQSGDSPGSQANTSLTQAFSTAVETATLDVVVSLPMPAPNTAPALNGVPVNAPGIIEDSKPTGVQVSVLLTGAVTDPDLGDLQGIAVSGLTGTANGVWQYSSNGTTWKPVGAVSEEVALLLKGSDKIRYLPNLNATASATFTYHAWDQTRGTAGQYANLKPEANTGLATPFSTNTVTATVAITAINDAPVLNIKPNPALTTLKPGGGGSNGNLVSDLLGNALTDPDTGALQGIAVTKALASTKGSWQYQLQAPVPPGAPTGWTTFNAVTATNVLYLRDIDRVRFVPAFGFNGTDTISYRGWDQTSGVPGGRGSPTLNTSLSLASESATVSVTDLNTRPVMDITPEVRFPSIAVNDKTSTGALVSSLLGSSVTDADAGSDPGIAVVFADNKNGLWQASVKNGPWFAIGNVKVTDAVLLTKDDRIRFVPNTGYVGSTSIQFKAWDRSDGTPAGNASTAGSTAYSTAIETATLAVNTAPVLSVLSDP